MIRRALASIAVGLALLLPVRPSDAAGSPTIAPPQVRGNLAAYFVRGTSGPERAISLNEAVRQGHARVRMVEQQVRVENPSSHPIFVQAGTLLRGGAQDQVVATGAMIPPLASSAALDTYCIEGDRSDPRAGEDATAMSPAPFLIMLPELKRHALGAPAPAGSERSLRQIAVWLGVDAIRNSLSVRVGGKPAPTASLVLALEDAKLAGALHPFLDLLSAPVEDDVVGVVFAVNNRVVGGDVYASRALFAAMWPALLRSYAVQAVADAPFAADPAAFGAPPSSGRMLVGQGAAREVARAAHLPAASSLPTLEDVSAFLSRAGTAWTSNEGVEGSADLPHRGYVAEPAVGLESVRSDLVATIASASPSSDRDVVLPLLRALHDREGGSVDALRFAVDALIRGGLVPDFKAISRTVAHGDGGLTIIPRTIAPLYASALRAHVATPAVAQAPDVTVRPRATTAEGTSSRAPVAVIAALLAFWTLVLGAEAAVERRACRLPANRARRQVPAYARAVGSV